jgi:hypothetical protein
LGYKPILIAPTATTKEKTEMAAVPQINTTEIEKKHAAYVSDFTHRSELLTKRPINEVTANLAAELDTDAKRWLDAFDAETKPVKDALFKAHRIFTSFCAKLAGPADNARAVARRIVGTYQLEERRKAAAARLEQERLAREGAECQKQAEVDARLTEAADAEKAGNTDLAEFILQEAHDAEEAPAIPNAVPVEAPTRVEGTSVSFKKVGKVEDPVKYLCFLLNVPMTPEMASRRDLVNEAIASWSQSGINAQLKRGIELQHHGVSVTNEPTVRNLGR